MNGEVRIEFTGYALKTAMMGRIKPARPTAFINNDTGNTGGRFVDDLTQAPPGATHQEGCACQFRDSLGQFDLFDNRKARARFDLPAHADGDISSRAFTGLNVSQMFSCFTHHKEQVLDFGIGSINHLGFPRNRKSSNFRDKNKIWQRNTSNNQDPKSGPLRGW